MEGVRGGAGAAPGKGMGSAGTQEGAPGWREAGASVKAGRGRGRLSNKHYL